MCRSLAAASVFRESFVVSHSALRLTSCRFPERHFKAGEYRFEARLYTGSISGKPAEHGVWQARSCQERFRSVRFARYGSQMAPWKCLSCSALLYSIVAEIIGARAGTMVENEGSKRRRLVEFKEGCRYGKFGRTKAYELIGHDRIRAYKMGGKTMIDLDSVDEYHASLPRIEARAN